MMSYGEEGNAVTVKSGTATIVKCIDKETYIILTSCTMFKPAKGDEAEEQPELVKGHFFLRRCDKAKYACKFTVLVDEIWANE